MGSRPTRNGLTRLPAYVAVGGLSSPSKMPCYGYSIPAIHCKVGARLRAVKGSTCGSCYALKGRYLFPNVMNAMQRRHDSLDDIEAWVSNMGQVMTYLADLGETYFRWHDSGDIQSLDHLHAISRVAAHEPRISHWLPTREYAVVKTWLNAYETLNTRPPTNLTVRLSAHMVDKPAPTIGSLPTSSVTRGAPSCPAPTQNNECGSCRACWDPKVTNVSYHFH